MLGEEVELLMNARCLQSACRCLSPVVRWERKWPSDGNELHSSGKQSQEGSGAKISPKRDRGAGGKGPPWACRKESNQKRLDKETGGQVYIKWGEEDDYDRKRFWGRCDFFFLRRLDQMVFMAKVSSPNHGFCTFWGGNPHLHFYIVYTLYICILYAPLFYTYIFIFFLSL